jgi:adenosylcobinamide-GDP ribazoletransferase
LSSSLRIQLRSCAAAFTFLTRIPTDRLIPHDLTDLPGAITYFPIVGLVVGLAGSLVFGLVITFWSPVLAVLISIAFTIWMTGAFHEDALADAFDGFGGGWDSSQVLAIMKDSRVGSYALVGVISVLATKIAAIYSIFDLASAHGEATLAGILAVGRTLIAAHVLGRWSSVVLISRHPYVRVSTGDAKPAAGQPFTSNVTRQHVITATVLAFVISGIALGWSLIGAGLAAIAITLFAGNYFLGRIGGITGDALGAANQFVELSVYLILAARV